VICDTMPYPIGPSTGVLVLYGLAAQNDLTCQLGQRRLLQGMGTAFCILNRFMESVTYKLGLKLDKGQSEDYKKGCSRALKAIGGST
jgi:hypothetical protein